MADDAAARLYQAFVSQDPAQAIAVIEKVKASGVAQAQLFDQLFAPAMSLLGGAWASGAIDEYNFTQAAVVAEQIGSFVLPPAAKRDTGVTLVIGIMHRDLHSITKDVIDKSCPPQMADDIFAALVSMKPPLPPLGADASSVPAALTAPCSKSPSR